MDVPPPRDPVLEIRGLSVALPGSGDRKLAVDDVSLTVAPREILCVVGESGSGKSVTAHSIMGLLPQGQLVPRGGSIRLDGEELLGADARAAAGPARCPRCR